jgi:hypothetical protein
MVCVGALVSGMGRHGCRSFRSETLDTFATQARVDRAGGGEMGRHERRS